MDFFLIIKNVRDVCCPTAIDRQCSVSGTDRSEYAAGVRTPHLALSHCSHITDLFRVPPATLKSILYARRRLVILIRLDRLCNRSTRNNALYLLVINYDVFLRTLKR